MDFDNLYIIGEVSYNLTIASHNVTPFDLDFRFKTQVEKFKNSYLKN